ncbi:hypothetical protein KO481_29575 [Nocardia sp. NEAU-G5]|uniref:Uncharacterized protein n=1 Tax=Nocardia albiluteola TaxID=2842303 RepID=A0ABS6AZ63_9NOCA|nr:hypothetical protein [Nocardia albiluteola]MBU3062501.1 hypothetical protein [Nocardia albiluteola]MBU3065665.1 hypothetical protein [Nocardia albiluteola]
MSVPRRHAAIDDDPAAVPDRILRAGIAGGADTVSAAADAGERIAEFASLTQHSA